MTTNQCDYSYSTMKYLFLLALIACVFATASLATPMRQALFFRSALPEPTRVLRQASSDQYGHPQTMGGSDYPPEYLEMFRIERSAMPDQGFMYGGYPGYGYGGWGK